jgi:anti-sigma factor RsiW
MAAEFSDFRNSCTKNAPFFVYYYRGNIVRLRGEHLIAYLDGEADEVIKQHIKACDFCAARLERYAALQSDLLGALYRLHCPGSQPLGDY